MIRQNKRYFWSDLVKSNETTYRSEKKQRKFISLNLLNKTFR
jgi:hypothetical protein